MLLTATRELFGRYGRVTAHAWRARHAQPAPARTSLEREFLPAVLELRDTPAPAAAHAVLWTLIAALVVTLAWSIIGRVDVVAIAQGQVIATGKAKTIQAAETAVVRRIHVRDGQAVKAGDVLLELDAAGGDTQADSRRLTEALIAARLEAQRHGAMAQAAATGQTPGDLTAPAIDAGPSNAAGPDADTALGAPAWPAERVAAESRALRADFADWRARRAAVQAEITRREAELAATRELVGKLERTAPIAKRRADDYRGLVEQRFVSEHGWLEREKEHLEQQGDLAFHRARAQEQQAAVREAHARLASLTADTERTATIARLDAEKRAAQLAQELTKATRRDGQHTLRAPVDGTVQQLAIHTEGGVVTEAQPLMVIAPAHAQPEVEATLANKDVGFVQPGQKVEVKVETFPFTRYGTIPGEVSFVSNDAVQDKERGPVFQVRVKLERSTIEVDRKPVNLTPGMAVTAEVMTDRRRVIGYVVDPLMRHWREGGRER
jgi:hemolysin D